MPTYQFLLHTTGIRVDTGDGGPPAIGCYTSRRATAPDSGEAYRKVLEAMDSEAHLTDVFRSGHDAGLRPRTMAEKTYLIPWWRAILPWWKPGLVFYSEDRGDDEDETAE